MPPLEAHLFAANLMEKARRGEKPRSLVISGNDFQIMDGVPSCLCWIGTSGVPSENRFSPNPGGIYACPNPSTQFFVYWGDNSPPDPWLPIYSGYNPGASGSAVGSFPVTWDQFDLVFLADCVPDREYDVAGFVHPHQGVLGSTPRDPETGEPLVPKVFLDGVFPPGHPLAGEPSFDYCDPNASKRSDVGTRGRGVYNPSNPDPGDLAIKEFIETQFGVSNLCPVPPSEDPPDPDPDDPPPDDDDETDDCEDTPMLLPEDIAPLMQDIQQIQPIQPQVLNRHEKLLEQMKKLEAQLAAEGVQVSPPEPMSFPPLVQGFQIQNVGLSKQAQKWLAKYDALRLEHAQYQAEIVQTLQTVHAPLESLHQRITDESSELEYQGYGDEPPQTLAEFKDELINLVLATRLSFQEKNTFEHLSAMQSYTRLSLVYDQLLRAYLAGQVPKEIPVENAEAVPLEGDLESEDATSRFITRIEEISSSRKLINTWSRLLSQLQNKLVNKQANLKQQIEADSAAALPEMQAYLEDLKKTIFLTMVLEGLIDVNLEDFIEETNGFSIQADSTCLNRPKCYSNEQFNEALNKAYQHSNQLIQQVPDSLIEVLLEASFNLQQPGLWQEVKQDGRAQYYIDSYRQGATIAGLPERVEDIPAALLGVKSLQGIYRVSKYGGESALTALTKWIATNPKHPAVKFAKERRNQLQQHLKKFNKNQSKLAKACAGTQTKGCSPQMRISAKYANKQVKLSEICKDYSISCHKFPKLKDFSVKYDNNGVPDFRTLRDANGNLVNPVKHSAWIDASTADTIKAVRDADYAKYSNIWQKFTHPDGPNPKGLKLGSSEPRMTGHHSGNVRYIEGNKLQVEIQFVEKDLHEAFPHRGGFDYYRELLGKS